MKLWLIVIFCVVVAHMFAVHALMRKSGSQWEATMQSSNSARNNNQHSCLKVSDFYSVHLTTYFLSATDSSVEGPKNTTKKYDQYCDRVPGEGLVVFTVDLMEQDARDLPVALSFSQYDSRGQLKLVKEVPPNPHSQGTLTLERSRSKASIFSRWRSGKRRARTTSSKCLSWWVRKIRGSLQILADERL
jgi:hypothetical protein